MYGKVVSHDVVKHHGPLEELERHDQRQEAQGVLDEALFPYLRLIWEEKDCGPNLVLVEEPRQAREQGHTSREYRDLFPSQVPWASSMLASLPWPLPPVSLEVLPLGACGPLVQRDARE